MFGTLTGDPETTQAFLEMGALPWWSAPELEFDFLRPLSVLTHRLDYRLWPDSAVLMHLHNLLWLAACVVMAGFVYRRFIGPGWTAGIATLIFAVDESRAFPIFWIANRNALVGAFFYCACLILHDRWRKTGDRMSAVLAPVALLIALL